MKNPISHEGHRQRLKNRFLNSSLDNFEPHNVLELLLFYSIPRQDTNEIAHALMDRFGSLANVFDASFEELIKVNGIKENSATLIKLIPHLAKAYLLDKSSNDDAFNTAEKIGKYFVSKYVGEENECVYLMLLDNAFNNLGVVKIHEGNVNSAIVSPRRIVEVALEYKATMIVLVHNHPNGLLCPSADDIDTTVMLKSALDMFNIGLLEHFLVAQNSYVQIIRDAAPYLVNNSLPKLK